MVAAQPGYSIRPFSFTMQETSSQQNNENTLYTLEWREPSTGHPEWKKASYQNGNFTTDPLRTDINSIQLKIYPKKSRDTMYISCAISLNSIPFIPGRFILNKSECILANMQPYNGIAILNQHWHTFKETTQQKEILPQQRNWYFPKAYQYTDEPEPFLQSTRFSISAHLQLLKDQGIENYININKLYFVAQFPGSVFGIGYVEDHDEKKEKFDTYLMESNDGCASWTIKTGLPENITHLVFIAHDRFGVAQSYPSNSLLIFDYHGRLISSEIRDHFPNSWEENMFANADEAIRTSHPSGNEFSDPIMNNSHMPHSFHRQFTKDGIVQVRLDSLPYNPVRIMRSTDAGKSWLTSIELNSNETYVYLSMRKNKLVLLSYDYMMVSTDFGLTWKFYENKPFSGGEWNFIWLDDNTLVNVTQHYADYFTIQ